MMAGAHRYHVKGLRHRFFPLVIARYSATTHTPGLARSWTPLASTAAPVNVSRPSYFLCIPGRNRF